MNACAVTHWASDKKRMGNRGTEKERQAGGVYQSLKGQASELIRFGREKLLRLSLRTDRV